MLRPAHKNAWIAFFVSSSNLRKKVDDSLREAGCVPLEMYGLLLCLEESPGHRARMSELATRVFLTKSGATRLVDRAVKLGFVTREACPEDRRGTWAVLTSKGLAERVRAWDAYSDAVEKEFASRLSEEDARTMSGLLLPMIGRGKLIGLERD